MKHVLLPASSSEAADAADAAAIATSATGSRLSGRNVLGPGWWDSEALHEGHQPRVVVSHAQCSVYSAGITGHMHPVQAEI
jgi:hypothetical protein